MHQVNFFKNTFFNVYYKINIKCYFLMQTLSSKTPIKVVLLSGTCSSAESAEAMLMVSCSRSQHVVDIAGESI